MTTDFRFYLNRQGVQGRKGEKGEQGYSPTITVKSQTANEYVLTVQNEDGSFDTPNLRGNAIENRGGNYIRYNPTTEEMYTGDADLASTQRAGVVFLSTYEQLIAGGSENLIPTSQDVYNFVSQQIISGFILLLISEPYSSIKLYFLSIRYLVNISYFLIDSLGLSAVSRATPIIGSKRGCKSISF